MVCSTYVTGGLDKYQRPPLLFTGKSVALLMAACLIDLRWWNWPAVPQNVLI